MASGIVIYHSKSGNTRKMAEIIGKVMNAEGLKTEVVSVDEVKAELLKDYDAIVLGSPTYYGHMAAPIKELIDNTVSFHSQLDGKVGGAFSSSANIGGGNETAIIGMLEALLIAGLIIQGDPSGDHYGPVSIGNPDERVQQQCERRGRRIARLTLKLFG